MATKRTAAPRIVRRKRPLVVLSTRPERPERPFNAVVGHAIAEAAREYGWDLLDLRFTRGALPEHRPPNGALIEWLAKEPIAGALRKLGCPAVRMGRFPNSRDAMLPAVLWDVGAIGRFAAEHFAERQFRHVAYVGRDPWSMSYALYAAFRDRAAALGCQCHLLRLKTPPEEKGAALYEHRSHDVGAWLSTLPKPVGVLTFSDREAATLCAMCLQARLAVPEEVAVLGIGDNRLDCEMAPVELSSVDPALDAWGRQAAALLHRLMTGQPTPGAPLVVPPRGVVTRRSTDMLAVADPTVAHAMRFMWDHLEQNLSVDDVAAAVGAPRRGLERAFRSHLKRGVNAELRRRRLERCCELLRTTTLAVADIAPQVGFRSADFLHASFKQAFGTTPRRVRAAGEHPAALPPRASARANRASGGL